MNLRCTAEGASGNAQLRDLFYGQICRLKPKIFCDIGANDGEAALAIRRILPDTKVYAFEANPEIYEHHRARLAREGIAYLNLAINDTAGKVTLYAPRTLSRVWHDGEIIDAAVTEPPETAKASLLRRNEHASYTEFEVRSHSLDGFFREQDVELEHRSFALWIDVEGASVAVLAGAEEVLGSTSIILIEVENYEFWKGQKKVGDICEFLRKHDFVPIARDREYGDKQFNIVFLKSDCRKILAAIEKTDEKLGKHSLDFKKQIPVLIPCFNNPTYLRGMIEQLSQLGLQNLIVVDNGSDFPPLLRYLASIENTVTVIRQEQNRGPRAIFRDPACYPLLPQFFCITDPDLQFNPKLPADFLSHLIDLTEKYHVGKAGFALDVSEQEKLIGDIFQIGDDRCRIWEWEEQFWKHPLDPSASDIPYKATIDTTFAVYNKTYFSTANYRDAIRVAGRYTCRHLPWYGDNRLPREEASHYRATSKYSFYRGVPPPC